MDPDGTLAPPHPLLGAVAAIHGALDESDGFDPDYLPTADKQAYLRELLRANRRTEARIMRVLAGAGDIADATGARSAAHWLAHEECNHPGRYVGHERVGRRIHGTYPAVAAALAEGRIGADHARVIVAALDALPDQVPGHDSREARDVLVAKAEAHLVSSAAHHTPRELKVLGRRLLEVVAPEAADDVERELLEKEERAARRNTSLDFHRLGDGTTKVVARLPDLEAAILRKATDAFASPRRPGNGASDPATGEHLSASQRRGQALCALLHQLPVDGFPQHGGTPVNIVVTIDEDDLRRETGAGTLDTGDRISVTAVRQLACSHGIMPAVLGGKGEVLDVGRTRRLFTPAQRRAHLLRHQTCQAGGCDIPAAWCEAHHKTAWADGGATDLDDMAWLCAFHHHRAHDSTWVVEWSPSGTARFRRRE